MWMSVDRLEENVVVLVADDEKIYELSSDAYQKLTGRAPRESDRLSATLRDGAIIAAEVDDDETARRTAAARARLDRLFGRRP